MGRVNHSFRMKLAEAINRIKSELLSMVVDEGRRRGAEKFFRACIEEANALGNFDQPYIYGSMTIIGILDLQRQVDELRTDVERLKEELRCLKDTS